MEGDGEDEVVGGGGGSAEVEEAEVGVGGDGGEEGRAMGGEGGAVGAGVSGEGEEGGAALRVPLWRDLLSVGEAIGGFGDLGIWEGREAVLLLLSRPRN